MGANLLETAEQIFAEIEQPAAVPHPLGSALGWIRFLHCPAAGGGYAVAFVATITTLFIMFSTAWLASKSLPEFYQNFLGGFIAVLPAAVVTQFATERGWYFPPSLVVASCLVAQLAGLTLVQALQDAVTGAPVTASARFFETVLNTGAIIAGIGAALQFVHMVGIDMTPLDVSTTSGVLGGTTVRVLGRGGDGPLLPGLFNERRATVVAAATALVASIAHNIVQALAESSTMMPAVRRDSGGHDRWSALRRYSAADHRRCRHYPVPARGPPLPGMSSIPGQAGHRYVEPGVGCGDGNDAGCRRGLRRVVARRLRRPASCTGSTACAAPHRGERRPCAGTATMRHIPDPALMPARCRG